MIENLKDLKALLKLCRQQGVTKITLASVSLEFGDAPIRTSIGSDDDQNDEPFITNLEAPLTNEELVAFANGGLNEN